MEGIIEDLHTSDTKNKMGALEALLEVLHRSGPDLTLLETGKKMSLLNATISVVKDANPKVVLMALECVQLLMSQQKDVFRASLNMTFDTLLTKLGDNKEAVREAVKKTLLAVILELGPSVGFERLLTHLNHKNWKIREQILYTIVKLLDIYGEEVAVCPDLTSTVSSLLSDPQSNIRTLVIEVLSRLYSIFGESFIMELGSHSSVKQTHIRSIKDISKQFGQNLHISIPISRVDSGTVGSLSSMSSAHSSPCNSVSNGSTGGSSRKSLVSKTKSDSGSRLGFGGSSRSASSNSNERLSSTTGQIPSFSRASSSNSALSSDSAKDVVAFSPQWYLTLLNECKTTPTIYPSSEKDLTRILTTILDDIRNVEDWQARVGGLSKLQALVTGICYSSEESGNLTLKNAFVQEMKSTPVTDLLCSQINDLRSAVCKEACCTIATLARTLRNSFAGLARFFIGSLIKVLTQKIYVMTSASDRCLRIVVSSPLRSHYPKVIDIFIETISTSKNAQQRKKSFEYLTLAMAIWNFSDNLLEKMSDPFKKALTMGIRDANGDVRKASRHLYWVLKSIPSYEDHMNKLINSFDTSTKKHIKQELQAASEDFIELLNNPTGGLEGSTEIYRQFSPFEERHSVPDSNDVSFPLNDRAITDRKVEGFNKSHPPPLPSQSQKVVSTQSNLATGPSRILQSSTKMPSNTPKSSCDHSDAPRNEKSSTVCEESIVENQTHYTKSAVGGARRTSMVPERIARPKVGSEVPDAREEQDYAPTVPHEMPPPGPPPLSISNSIRTKSAGRVARQSGATSRQTIQRDESLVDKRDSVAPIVRESVNSSSRFLKQTHSSGAQRVVVNQVSKNNQESRKSVPSMEYNSMRSSRTRSPSKRMQSETHVATTSVDGTVTSRSQVTAASTHSVSEIRTLVQDSRWDQRVVGFEAICARFTKWLTAFHDQNSGTSNFPPYLEEFLDCCIQHLSDSHHKVVGTASMCLETLCRTKPNPLISHRMSILLSSLLTRLGDRKANVRAQTNTLLDMIRESYDAPHILAALSPRMTELPERTRTTVLQFLISLIPHCESYFNVQLNMSTFLNRLVIVLGHGGGVFVNSGQRTSSSLLTSGQRLLELLYSVSPENMLSQMASLPLQQQNALKNMMEVRIPNIDALVLQAGRQEWLSQAQSQRQIQNLFYDSSIPPTSSGQQFEENEFDLDKHDLTPKSSTSPVYEEPLPIYSDLVSNDHIAELSSKLNSPFLFDTSYRSKTNVDSSPDNTFRVNNSSGPSSVDSFIGSGHVEVIATNKLEEEKAEADESPLQQEQSSPNTRSTSERYSLVKEDHSNSRRDVVWLLSVLRPDGDSSREEKKSALIELKKWAKSCSENFWRTNSSQIISVCLEAFNPVVFSSSLEALLRSNSSKPMQTLTGLSPPPGSTTLIEQSESNADARHAHMLEAMHIACKGLVVLVKLNDGRYMEAFLELLVARLCSAATFAPVAISLHCEQILSLASALDPPRFSRLLLPFISTDAVTASSSGVVSSEDGYQQSRLLALHTLSSSVTHLKSSDLISLLPDLTTAILPYFSSPLVDVRKSVVFVLVEVYMKVGDALYPFVKDLATSQRKLLTVYIERQMNRNKMH